MSNFDNGLELSENRNPLVSVLLILFVSFVIGQFIGWIIGAALGMFFFNGPTSEYFNMFTDMFADPRFKIPIYISQGMSAIIGFIVLPALFMIIYEKKTVNDFFIKSTTIIHVVLAATIAIVFMGFNSWFVEWNMSIHFPDALAGVEAVARQMEESAMIATKYLTTFETPWMFILGFIIISIVPGIGEELLFRGFIQNYLHKGFNNIHIAIWVSAILFSAIHMQFFGFIPRMLLGALFGYLYYWSGNLLIPMVAHAVNNGFMIIVMYLYQLEVFDMNPMDIENTEGVSLSTFMMSTIASALLIFYFRKINTARAS